MCHDSCTWDVTCSCVMLLMTSRALEFGECSFQDCSRKSARNGSWVMSLMKVPYRYEGATSIYMRHIDIQAPHRYAGAIANASHRYQGAVVKAPYRYACAIPNASHVLLQINAAHQRQYAMGPVNYEWATGSVERWGAGVETQKNERGEIGG